VEHTLRDEYVKRLREQILHRFAWSGARDDLACRLGFIVIMLSDEGEAQSARFLSSLTGIDRNDILSAGAKLAGIVDIYDEPDRPNFSPPRPKRSKSELRRSTISECGMRCSYCEGMGTEVDGPDGRPWCLDRIIPGAAGGQYHAHNVTLACWECNSRRGCAPIEKRIFSAHDWLGASVEILRAWAVADLAAWESIQ
jgi:hypothetical protein